MKKLFSLLLVIFPIVFVQAQQSSLLDNYRSMALDYNHDLKTAENSINACINVTKSARTDYIPVLSGNANFQYTGNPYELSFTLPNTSQPTTFHGQNMQYGFSLSLMQPVYVGGRIVETIRLAEQNKLIAEQQYELLRTLVSYQTDIQYWNTVASLEICGIVAESYRSMLELSQRINERVQVGLVDPQDLLMTEVKLNESAYRLKQAQTSFETSLMAFNSLIGVDIKLITSVDSIIPNLIFDDSLLDLSNNNHPEINIAEIDIQRAESRIRLNDSKYLPQLYVGIDGGFYSPGYNFKKDINPNYTAFATVSVPISTWGKRSYETKALKFQMESSKEQLNKVKDEILLEVQTAQQNLLKAVQQVELTKQSLEKAKENERKSLERYEDGKNSIVEVIDAQTYRQTAQYNYVEAKAMSQTAYSALIKALNKY